MPSQNGQLWNALIRTHHITSRKKVAHLKKAADTHKVYALLHSGKCPGIMYCEGEEDGVKHWVSSVQSLRYKDYQLAIRPAPFPAPGGRLPYGKIVEVSSVKEFSTHMQSRGLLDWWRKAMGYT